MRRAEPALRVLAAGVFVLAGALKILDPADFAWSLARLQILPRWGIAPAAVVLPWIELAGGLALFLPSHRVAAARLLAGLLAVFSAVLVVAWAKGESNCACFGGRGGFLELPAAALLRNALLLAALGLTVRAAPVSPASGIPR
jgi:putative oxidoreductase